VLALALATTIGLTACGDDGDDPTTDDTTTTSTSTTAPAEVEDTTTTTTTTTGDDADAAPTTTTSSTTTAPPPDGDPFITGSVTNADGARVDWELTGDATQLCFAATITDPETDPDKALTEAEEVDTCLTPEGGLDGEMDDAMSVSIGRVDGTGAFGYLWGRVDPGIVTVSLEYADNSQQVLELVDGPTEVQLFAVVVDTDGPALDSIDAVSGTRIEDSEPVGDFVRSGPTYPVIAPPPPPVVEYPVTGG
jgi:hypothetical protein